MKKFLLTLPALLLLTTVGAQTKKDYTEPLSTGRHELSIGIGLLPLKSDIVYNQSGYGDSYSYYYDNYYYQMPTYSMSDRIEQSKTYLSELRQSCAFNLTYSYRVARWLQLGVNVSYHNVTRNKYSTTTHERIGNYDRDFVSIVPTVRFNHLRGENVKLYSSVGIGYGSVWVDNIKDGSKERFDYCSFNFTALGVSVGRKLFGTAELGVLDTGWARFAVGYRF